jgi:hypothetical protein
MSRGPDNIIAEALEKLHVTNPSLAAEEVLDALEAEDYIPVARIQIRSQGELLAALVDKDLGRE